MRETIKTTVLVESVVADLRTQVRGELIRPSDEGYDKARKVWKV